MPIVKIHGPYDNNTKGYPREAVPGTGRPSIWVDFQYYNVRRGTGDNINRVYVDVKCLLKSLLTSKSYYGYNLWVYAQIDNNSWTSNLLFHKPASVNRWSDNVYNGTLTLSSINTSTTVKVSLWVKADCKNDITGVPCTSMAQGRKMYTATLSVAPPYKKATIGFGNPNTVPTGITTYNKIVKVNYTANTNADGLGTEVQYKINDGNWVTISGSGDSAGSFNFTPSSNPSKNVSEGSSFKLYLRRKHKVNTNYNSNTVNITMNTYPALTLSGLTVTPNPINANSTLTISWNSVGNRLYNSNGTQRTDSPVYDIIVNGVTHTTVSNTSNVIKGLDGKFNITYQKDNSNISIQVRARYPNIGTTSQYASRNVRIHYRPVVGITNINPSNTTYLSLRNTSEAPSSKTISWSWPAPGGNSNGQNGIVTNYHVYLLYKDKNGNEQAVNGWNPYKTTSKSVTINVNTLYPNRPYYLRIVPVYEKDRIVLSGPSFTTIGNYLIRVNKLSTPSIVYPYTGSNWYGNNPTFRIAIIPPADSDYSSLNTEDKNNYRYGDIEVEINGVSRLLSSYPNAFSVNNVNNLVYKDKMIVNGIQKGIVFNPNLASYKLSSSSYTVRVRFKNKASSVPSNFIWGDWSNSVTITDKGTLPTISTKKDEFIKAEHINRIYTIVVDMTKSYSANATYKQFISGETIIKANDFITLNNYLKMMYDIINNFVYGTNLSSVIFPNIQDSISSNIIIPKSGSYNEADFNLNNYIQRVLSWISQIIS